MLNTVSVKTLAEFVHRRGDLYPALGGRVTGEEGIATQRRAQQNRGGGYQREVAVKDEFTVAGMPLSVAGRVDGCDLSTAVPFVEEIKTTRAEPADAERAVGSAHWAQARLYAALLARVHPKHEQWQVRLLYCHPDSDAQQRFDETQTAEWLAEYLQNTLAVYADWLAAEQRYQAGRNHWLDGRAFPYGDFRAHQRALAGRVFQAFRDGEHLLLEAPTGSGKTMGVLYPALKALAGGHVRRLFYLTSRGTGALAAMKAAADVSENEQQLRVVDLIAKEKACLVEGMPCDERCPYSVGYYDRIHEALVAALSLRQMDRDAVRAVAEAHQVCQFELSLDAALWADLIVGDYNYLLDPVVRLQRFMDDESLGLLIDESHQLAERTRDMLSLELNREEVKAAIAESPPAAIARRLKSVDRVLMEIRRELVAGSSDSSVSEEVVIAPPEKLLRSAQKALEALAEEELDLGAWPLSLRVLFDLSRLVRAQGWVLQKPGAHDPGGGEPDDVEAWKEITAPFDVIVSGDDAALAPEFRYLAQVTDRSRGRKSVRIRLACLDAAPYLEAVLAGYGPHVRFSGTVTPLDLYQRLHGQSESAGERVESPFAPEQLATLIVTDLPVYYRQRAASLPRLADLVQQTVNARAGNYLVALPSFEYLNQLAEVLDSASFELLVQLPGMDEDARAEFLGRFQDDAASRVGLIVLGGLFAESVDFRHAPLAGVVCVGVGLPPVSRQKEEMRGHFDAALGAGGGDTVAYQQPAMTKVLQMAGRLLRSPEDRGVLLLVDDRFARPAFQRFFPRHWQPISLRAAEVPERLENFWQAVPGLPRLRTANSPAPEDRPSAPQTQ